MSDLAQLYITQQANMEYIYPHFFAAMEMLQTLYFLVICNNLEFPSGLLTEIDSHSSNKKNYPGVAVSVEHVANTYEEK
jgi:hypothetical protein